MPPALFFFLRIALAILGLLWFYINIWIVLYLSYRFLALTLESNFCKELWFLLLENYKPVCMWVYVYVYIYIYVQKHILKYIYIYSWPLNNMDLNCTGPLIHGIFSINTTLLHHCGWLNPRIWNHRYRGPTTKLYGNFNAGGWHP